MLRSFVSKSMSPIAAIYDNKNSIVKIKAENININGYATWNGVFELSLSNYPVEEYSYNP